MHIRYRVDLEESERQYLETIVAGGTRAVRRVKRAQILLAAAAAASEGCCDHVGTVCEADDPEYSCANVEGADGGCS